MPADLPRVERDEDGRPVWIHVCRDEEVRVTLPLGEHGWTWTADGGLEPSILCHPGGGCGVHGYWVGGEHPWWRAA